MYNKELENLIDIALEDGKLTEQEQKVLKKKAEDLGIDSDEFEMVLAQRLQSRKKDLAYGTVASKAFSKWWGNLEKDTKAIVCGFGVLLLICLVGGIIGWISSIGKDLTFNEYMAKGDLKNAERKLDQGTYLQRSMLESEEEYQTRLSNYQEEIMGKRRLLLFDAYFQNKDYDNAQRILKEIPIDEGYSRYQQLLDLYYYREDYERAELIAKSDAMLYKEYLIKRTKQILTQSGKQEALNFFNQKFFAYDWGSKKEEYQKDLQNLLNSYK